MLVFVSLLCVAQVRPRPGLIGHQDCSVYFYVERHIHTMVGSVVLPESQAWGLSKADVDQWVKKGHKKYPGFCYVDPQHIDLTSKRTIRGAPDLPLRLYYFGFTEESFHYSVHSTATETRTQDVPVKGDADVYDNSGQRVGTADVTGTAKVETTTTYPVDVPVHDHDVSGEVRRLNADGSSTQLFSTPLRSLYRSGMGGVWGALADALARDPRDKALDDCLKFLWTEAGLEKKKK
jgi:hypothetical protein